MVTQLIAAPLDTGSDADEGIRERRSASYAQYLAEAGDAGLVEWVNGEMIRYMPPQTPHATLIEFLAAVIGLYVRVQALGRLLLAPYEVRLERSSREPDVFFVAADHLDRLDTERMNGAPDLVVEVVSTESARRDRVDKYDEYEEAGVAEYWVLDNRPNRRRAQFFQLGADARYHQVEPDAHGVYASRALAGFWLRVDWLWAEQPDALRAIAQVIGPQRLADALDRAGE